MKAKAGHLHDKPHHPHWPLQALLFAFVLGLGLKSAHVADTWIHVKTGAVTLAQGRVPREDPFSHGSLHADWTTDSWLFDVAAAKLDDAGGPTLLIAVKAVAIAAAFALVLPINHGSPIVSAALLALAACAGWRGWVETPAAFAPLLFALMLRLLRPRHRFHWKQGLAAAGLTVLWANLHGATAILALWMVGLKTFKASLRTTARERAGHWLTLVACVLLIGWNPLGWGILGRSFADALSPAGSWPHPWLSLYTPLAVGALVSCWFTLQPEFVTTLAAATVVALSLALPGLRPLACLAAVPVISLAAGHWLRPRPDTWPRVVRWAVFAGALFAGYHRFVTAPFARAGGYGAPALAGAVHFLRSHDAAGTMFNEPETGAELIGLLGRPVFSDERPGLYAADFLREAAGWPVLFPHLDSVYHFDYAVLLNRRAAAPARVLDESRGWRLAYADDDALVYARENGPDRHLLAGAAKRPLPVNRLWPDELDARLLDAKGRPSEAAAKETQAELDRWQLQAPDCVQALLWKAYALGRLGRAAEAQRYLELARQRPRLDRDPELQAVLGFILEARGEPGPAKTAYRAALSLAMLRGDRKLESRVLPRLAALHRSLGEEPDAREIETRAKKLAAGSLDNPGLS